MSSAPAVKHSFKEQMLQAREDAIVQTALRLLAHKGFEAMTVDEVAAAVGIAKASLYKHFASKDDLAAAAMLRLLRQAQAFLQAQPADQGALDKLQAAARWAMALQLAGEMPALPGRNSSLRAALIAHADCRETLAQVSELLGDWIAAAQQQGRLNPRLSVTAVLFTLYARACDPALEFLQAGGQLSDADIVELVLGACFEGLSAR
ncbi:MAG: TetR/AcrR family transcriptional regulator [Burkholderiaceae bacterium]